MIGESIQYGNSIVQSTIVSLLRMRAEQQQIAELGRSVIGHLAEADQLHLDRPKLLSVPSEERQGLLHDYLCCLVAAACGIDVGKVVADARLPALGIDSYAVISIQHSIEADLGAHVTASDLAHAANITDLAVRLDEQIRADATPSGIEVPVSYGRRSLWFLHEIEPGTAAHRIAVALRFRGELDMSALEYALDALVARHASCDTAFPSNDGEPVQRIAGRAREWLRENDAPGLDDAQLTGWLKYAAREPFDLACGPLLRIHLYHRATEETVVLVVAHHFIADFWSMTTLVRELEMLYSEHTGGMSAPLPELTDLVRHYSWVSGSRESVHAVVSSDSVVCSDCRKAERDRAS